MMEIFVQVDVHPKEYVRNWERCLKLEAYRKAPILLWQYMPASEIFLSHVFRERVYHFIETIFEARKFDKIYPRFSCFLFRARPHFHCELAYFVSVVLIKA